MEKKIGEIFSYNGQLIKVIKSKPDDCEGCAFHNRAECAASLTEIGSCSGNYRSDGKFVKFLSVEGMS